MHINIHDVCDYNKRDCSSQPAQQLFSATVAVIIAATIAATMTPHIRYVRMSTASHSKSHSLRRNNVKCCH